MQQAEVALVRIFSEEDANVTYIERKVRQEMDDNTLLIVGATGLRYTDQEGTRGVGFWKVGSRKLFAITKQDFERREDEEMPAKRSKKKRSLTSDNALSTVEAIENMSDELTAVQTELARFRKLAFRHRFSISFIRAFEDAFECSICKKTPATLPLIACQGCSSLIGCELCVNTWYANDRNMVKNCPKCRVERGLSKTFVLRGFEELIHQLQILREETNPVSDTGSDFSDDE